MSGVERIGYVYGVFIERDGYGKMFIGCFDTRKGAESFIADHSYQNQISNKDRYKIVKMCAKTNEEE